MNKRTREVEPDDARRSGHQLVDEFLRAPARRVVREEACVPESACALFAGRRFANLNHRLVVDIRVGDEDEPKAPTAER